jgi:hypothetical protein
MRCIPAHAKKSNALPSSLILARSANSITDLTPGLQDHRQFDIDCRFYSRLTSRIAGHPRFGWDYTAPALSQCAKMPDVPAMPLARCARCFILELVSKSAPSMGGPVDFTLPARQCDLRSPPRPTSRSPLSPHTGGLSGESGFPEPNCAKGCCRTYKRGSGPTRARATARRRAIRSNASTAAGCPEVNPARSP